MHRIDTQHAAALPRCVTRGYPDQVFWRRPLRANWTVLGVALASLSSGCAVRHAMINRVDDAVAANGEVYASDPDVELVGRRPAGVCIPRPDWFELRIYKAALPRGCARWRGARLARLPRFSKHRDELIRNVRA
jgi:hypothetical protein